VTSLLSEKVAIVSGVGPGLGTQVALALARKGAKLAIGARSEHNLAETAAQIRSMGGEVICVPTDVTVRAQCERLVERCVGEFGRLDCLVNNAAAGYGYETFEDVDLDKWRQTVEVNLFGSLQMSQAVLPPMKSAGSGSIVFINTMNIHTVPPGQGGYTTSKGALLTAARVLARELGRHRIRVNSVIPGWMWGPSIKMMFEQAQAERGVSIEQQKERVASNIPLGFIPSDEDCADCVVFLASDLARAVTGHSLDVNGGEVMH
jgi:NAD(P)-dependent dehydrogenase (short-subunit alcohol dehydrogenase family)